MRVGLLGASAIAPNAVLLPAAKRDDVSITAVAARDLVRAQAYAAQHDIPAVAESYAALVARDDVDLVYCALPPSAHVEAVRMALDAGKPVLLEKPFAMHVDDARTIAAMADAAGLPVIEALHYRFHPLFQRAVDLLANGAIGQVTHASVTFETTIVERPGEIRWDSRHGGGAMMDLGCYCVHALRSLLRVEPIVIGATGAFRHDVDAELTAELDFAGVPAKLHCSMIGGTGRLIRLTGRDGVMAFHQFGAAHRGGEITIDTATGRTTETTAGDVTTYDAQLDHVVRVFRGQAAPITGGIDAIANMAVIDAARAMARG